MEETTCLDKKVSDLQRPLELNVAKNLGKIIWNIYSLLCNRTSLERFSGNIAKVKFHCDLIYSLTGSEGRMELRILTNVMRKKLMRYGCDVRM